MFKWPEFTCKCLCFLHTQYLYTQLRVLVPTQTSLYAVVYINKNCEFTFDLPENSRHAVASPKAARANMSRPPLAPLLPTRQLAVFTVFFGQLPPWLPLTLQSMAHNPGVSFIVIGDAAPPALLPPNVHFETVSYPEMQARLSRLLTPGNSSSVRYSFTYK
eukprot:scaffold108212_cov51-Phaeocystis_antarctica.AAC.2